MNWKKKLATYASLTVLATFIIHIINKLIYFMSTIDNLLGRKEGLYYDGDLEKFSIQKRALANQFY